MRFVKAEDLIDWVKFNVRIKQRMAVIINNICTAGLPLDRYTTGLYNAHFWSMLHDAALVSEQILYPKFNFILPT